MAAKILRILNVNLELVQQRLEQTLLYQPHLQGKLNLTPTVKRITELAVEEARRSKGDSINTVHLLLGLLKEDKFFPLIFSHLASKPKCSQTRRHICLHFMSKCGRLNQDFNIGYRNSPLLIGVINVAQR